MSSHNVEKSLGNHLDPGVPRDQQLQLTISNTEAPPPVFDVDAFNPPDGGLLAWSQVLAGLLINCMAWGSAGSFGVYQLYYEETLGLPRSQISWVGSVQTFLAFGVGAVAGRLSDAGHVRSTVAVGSFFAVFGIFMTSLATKYWHIFLAQGICTGLGLGIMFMPAVSVVNSYFKKKRAFALAVAATGTGFGSLIFPSTVQYLIPQVGFPWAVRCCGFVALVMVVIANALLRPYLPPRKSGPFFEWDAFRELPYLFFSLGAFLNFYGLYFGFFYINVYARSVIGFTSVDAVGLLLIVNGMSIPARPIVGYLADCVLGPINTLILGMSALGIMVFIWIGVDSRTGMYVFCTFFGLTTGACQGTFVGANASLTKDPRKLGTRFGMIQTLCAFATLAGPPTAGAIIDKAAGNFLPAQIWGGTVIIAGASLIAASRVARTGWIIRAKV